jgi:hypothetical protein
MFVTAAVFHPEMSPLNKYADANMCLAVGCQGWAGRCRGPDALRQDPLGRQGRGSSASRTKMMEQERLIVALITRLPSPAPVGPHSRASES